MWKVKNTSHRRLYIIRVKGRLCAGSHNTVEREDKACASEQILNLRLGHYQRAQ